MEELLSLSGLKQIVGRARPEKETAELPGFPSAQRTQGIE